MKTNRTLLRWLVALLGIVLLVGSYFIYRGRAAGTTRTARLLAWINDPAAHPEWAIQRGARCGQAPFIFPTDGFVGYLWGDSFRPGHRHQGIDIFGGGDVDQTPVVAAYPGYLTRLPDWKSTVIIRIPHDPLDPGRQIWTYYTHMADEQRRTRSSPRSSRPARARSTLKPGRCSATRAITPATPATRWACTCTSRSCCDDGQGSFRNELEIRNTLDPSPYLGLPFNAATDTGEVPVCPEEAGS